MKKGVGMKLGRRGTSLQRINMLTRSLLTIRLIEFVVSAAQRGGGGASASVTPTTSRLQPSRELPLHKAGAEGGMMAATSAAKQQKKKKDEKLTASSGDASQRKRSRLSGVSVSTRRQPAAADSPSSTLVETEKTPTVKQEYHRQVVEE